MGWANLFGRLTTPWWSRNRSSESSTSSSSHPPPVFAVDRTEVAVTTAASTVPELTLRELNKATRSFSAAMLIGRGHNDTAVYRASLQIGNGNTGKTAAVAKTLGSPPASRTAFSSWSASDDELLRQHVLAMSRLRHDNVVRLLGYTIDAAAGVRALLFEFADVGTLHDALHGPPATATGEPQPAAAEASSNDRPVLSWEQRTGIALDVARGLEYLHDAAGVSHYGITAANVLLFHGFRAKIAAEDLFLQLAPGDGNDVCMVYEWDKTCYYPPEFLRSGRISKLFDVYSYGVLVLELLTGRKGSAPSLRKQKLRLSQWAAPLVREGRVEQFMDPKLGTEYPPAQALKLATIALWCLEEKPKSRPSMADVAQMISREVIASSKTRMHGQVD